MFLKEMKFKGKTVFVEVDEGGSMILNKGRAQMKYRVDDNMVYSPWPQNIDDFGGPVTVADKVVSSPAQKKSPKTQKRAAVSPQVKITADAIVAYTDGGCIGNPGPAGLGYLIRFPDGRLVKKGEPMGHGTNNIAELTAILRVLELVEDTFAPLVIHTDSSYSIGVLTQNWKAKANRELIAKIKKTMAPFKKLELRKVKGHSGVPDNELVDDLARISAETQQVQE